MKFPNLVIFLSKPRKLKCTDQYRILPYGKIFYANLKSHKQKISYACANIYLNLENLFPQDWSNLIDQMMSNIHGELADKLIK